MEKIVTFFRNLMALVLVMGLSFGIGFLVGGCKEEEEPETVIVYQEKEGFDLELPMEVEKRVVTVEEVETKLVEIGELSTYSGDYYITLGKDETRYALDKLPILGTKNSITISCKGVVKVGYDMSDIIVHVDDDKIYISIPEPKINDNYVIWDSVFCNESNNILNPIEFSQYQEIIEEIEKEGLQNVLDRGIYDAAEDNLKVLIEQFLAEFDGYEIVYM